MFTGGSKTWFWNPKGQNSFIVIGKYFSELVDWYEPSKNDQLMKSLVFSQLHN